MRLSDRLNACVLRRVDAMQPVPDGAMSIAARFAEVDGLVAAMADRFVGADMILVAQLRGGGLIVADEQDPHWTDVIEALDRSGRAAYPSSEWMIRLLADAGRTPITLIAAEDPA